MKRSRILMIEFNEDFTVGGSHQVLFDLATHLNPQRFVPVCAFRQNNLFAERLQSMGFEVHLFEKQREKEVPLLHSSSWLQKMRGRLYALRWRLRFLRKHRIDLVHINNTPNFGLNTWLPLAHLLRLSCIANAMGEVFPVKGRLNQKFFRSFDKVLAISQHMKRECLAAGIPERCIDVLPLGVDIKGFRSRLSKESSVVRGELGLSGNQVLAVMVGNIREWKGQHVVLEAISQLPEEVKKNLFVAFVGAVSKDDIDYKARLQQMVAEAGLEPYLKFLGSRRDVPDLFRAADFAIHASTTPEPFGLVVPEAMSVGTPVIGTTIGGPGEVITPESGRTFDPSIPEQLAQCLQTLVKDQSLRESLSQGAIQRAEEYDLRRYVEHLEKLYEQALH